MALCHGHDHGRWFVFVWKGARCGGRGRSVDGGEYVVRDGRRRLEVVRPSFVQTLPASLPRVTTDGPARDTWQRNTIIGAYDGCDAMHAIQYAKVVPPPEQIGNNHRYSPILALAYQAFFGLGIEQWGELVYT